MHASQDAKGGAVSWHHVVRAVRLPRNQAEVAAVLKLGCKSLQVGAGNRPLVAVAFAVCEDSLAPLLDWIERVGRLDELKKPLTEGYLTVSPIALTACMGHPSAIQGLLQRVGPLSPTEAAEALLAAAMRSKDCSSALRVLLTQGADPLLPVGSRCSSALAAAVAANRLVHVSVMLKSLAASGRAWQMLTPHGAQPAPIAQAAAQRKVHALRLMLQCAPRRAVEAMWQTVLQKHRETNLPASQSSIVRDCRKRSSSPHIDVLVMAAASVPRAKRLRANQAGFSANAAVPARPEPHCAEAPVSLQHSCSGSSGSAARANNKADDTCASTAP